MDIQIILWEECPQFVEIAEILIPNIQLENKINWMKYSYVDQVMILSMIKVHGNLY